jgi:hypothetical protein
LDFQDGSAATGNLGTIYLIGDIKWDILLS